MANQRPLRGSEKRVDLDVGGSCASTQTAILILDKQLADQGFTETVEKILESRSPSCGT